MLVPLIPEKIIWLMPAYWEIPLMFTKYNLWIGQLYNLFLIIVIIYSLFKHRKNMLYFWNGLFKKNNVINLGGKTWKWKTRLLAKIAFESQNKDNNIIIWNFYSKNIDLFYASFNDFCLLQADICLLALHSNFKDKEENEKILNNFKWYFNLWENEKLIKSIKWIYNIITIGDEFYAYLHNRSFMQNFAKEKWKKLLLDLHQTRHHNQTLLLASQDTDNLDLDIRQIAHQELEVTDYLLWLIYWFNIYKYLTKKEQTELWREFKKLNKIPYLFINYYEINQIIEKIYNRTRKIKWLYRKYIRKDKTEFLYKKIILFKNKILPYNTKFDIRIDIDIYKPWDLFRYIIKLEKEKFELEMTKKNKLQKS